MAVTKTTDATTKSTRKPATAAAAATPATAKPATRKTAAAKPATAKTATAKTSPGKGKSAGLAIGAEERYRMTEVAAYYLAERNGFAGHPVDYWSQAEAQISQLLGR